MKARSQTKFGFMMGILFLLIFTPLLGEGAKKIVPTGQLRIARSTLQNEALDPIRGPADNKTYLTLLYDSLVGVKPPSLEPSPDTGIAHRWEHSPDYKTYTFYLRKGIKFHNGAEVTADDVAFTIERAAGPASVGGSSSVFKQVLDRCEVVDRYTVKAHLKEPYGMFVYLLSKLVGAEGMVVPKKYIEEKGEKYFEANPIGTGPYKFKKQVPGSYIEFEAVDSPHWALGVPKYKIVRFSLVSEATARIGMLQRGDVDVIELPRERADEVKAAKLPIREDPMVGSCWFMVGDTFNSEYPVSDIRVRKAMNISIDRQTLWKTLFRSYGTLNPSGMLIPISIGWKEGKKLYPYDPEMAKQLLKEAGYGPGQPKGILKLTIINYPYADFPEARDVLQAMASYWQAVGIEPKIVTLPDYGTFRKQWLDGKTEGRVFPMVTGGRVWVLPILQICFHSKGLLCVAKTPELDEAITRAGTTLDAGERAAFVNKVDQLVYDNYLGVPLFYAPGLIAVNPKTVTGYEQWNPGPIPYDWNLEWLITRPPYGRPGMP